jgi:hypothetical protein
VAIHHSIRLQAAWFLNQPKRLPETQVEFPIPRTLHLTMVHKTVFKELLLHADLGTLFLQA